MNMLAFQYELSPIAVLYRLDRESFLWFLVKMSAIVGGIFTVAEIVDSVLHRSIGVLLKQRMGKLS